jgi:two-component system chemotaxis response regulator CheY
MALTILVVDDSALIVRSVTTILELNGYKTESADDGETALAKLKAGLKNGVELIKQTRMLPGFRFMPILVMTTESQQTLRDEAKALGATGWVVKPVGGELLISIIKKLLPGA